MKKEEVIKLLQDKIRMAKAKLIQVASGQGVVEAASQAKSLLVNMNAKTTADGQIEASSYEIYAKASKSNSSNSDEKNYNSNTAYYNLSTSVGHQQHEANVAPQLPQSQPPQQLEQPLKAANNLPALNNLDSGFDVDSSTCTTTTTSN